MRLDRMCFGTLAAAMWVVGCGGGGHDARENEVPGFVGSWSPGDLDGDEEGQFLVHPWFSTVTYFLEIEEDGTGFVVLQNYSVNVFNRVPLTWVRGLNDHITLLIPANPVSRSYSFEIDGTHLILRESGSENVFRFWRNTLQQDIRDASLAIEPTPLSSPIHPETGLVAAGSGAWFEIYGHVLVDTVGNVAPMDAIYSHPVASQNGDLWMACSPCETPGKLQRRTVGNALVSELDLSARLSGALAGAYWDGGSLWIAEETTDTGDTDQHTTLWRFDANGVELKDDRYSIAIETFTFHEGRLFAIVNLTTQVLVEIDTAYRSAILSRELPTDVRWQGLASVGGKLKILGAGLNEYPVLAEVENP